MNPQRKGCRREITGNDSGYQWTTEVNQILEAGKQKDMGQLTEETKERQHVYPQQGET